MRFTACAEKTLLVKAGFLQDECQELGRVVLSTTHEIPFFCFGNSLGHFIGHDDVKWNALAQLRNLGTS